MKRSFYQFALSFRGGKKDDLKARFAERMFHDSSFPKEEMSFDELSRYVEEQADEYLSSTVFDELFELYTDRFGR